MSNRRGTEVRQRRAQVGVRLLPDEMEHLRRTCEREQLTPGEVLRRAFFASAEHVAMRAAYIAAGRPPICPCCGGRASGLHLPRCVDLGWSHSETCATYRYADDECKHCFADFSANPDSGGTQ